MAGGRRSPAAQLEAMRREWPEFNGAKCPDGMLVWAGPLMPKAQIYDVLVCWKPGLTPLPTVFIRSPKLRPRTGGTFEEIPHLIFDQSSPEDSALCLFDPSGGEWSEADLIAETTVKWASEWLFYYELWHVTGEWLAPGVGYESVAQMSLAEAQAVRAAAGNVH